MFFFLNDPAPPEIYPLSLHDALPIPKRQHDHVQRFGPDQGLLLGGRAEFYLEAQRHREPPLRMREILPRVPGLDEGHGGDRKSTRLNSSHANISYAVFCLEKKHNNSP